MSAESDIIFRTEGVLGHITLNRPRALNALTLSMCASVQGQLDAWATDDQVHAVLIDAVPGRAFCAGGDIRAASEWGRAGDPRALQFFRTEYRMNATIKEYGKPYIALLDGIVMGGGVGISVHGAYRIATENTLFAMPETAIGFFPDVGGSYFLPRCPGALGMCLGLSGTRLRPADALYAGIATHFVPAAKAGQIAPRLAAGEAIDAVLASVEETPAPSELGQIQDAVDRVFSAPTVECVFDRLTREGQWGQDLIHVLATRSPTSLKLVHRQLGEGRQRPLKECLAMELQIAAHILNGHDFHEGVRAVIVDKDNRAEWRPARLEDIGEATISTYFAPIVEPLSF